MAMAPRNFANFVLSVGVIGVFLVAVPSLFDAVSWVALGLFVTRMAEWLMTRTRRYVLHKKVDPRNKAVLITGCDSGFGHMLAERLDKSGYQVFAGCLAAEGAGARDLAGKCSSKLLVLPLDVTSDQSVHGAVKFVEKNLGENELWAVVNNAGVAQAGEIDWTPMDEFQKVYDVNAIGTYRVTKAFLTLLQKSKGRVVNNTSLCGRLTCPGYVGYCISKSAAVAFTTGLRVEMAKWGVNAISVEAFFYRTPLTEQELNCKMIEDTWNRATPAAREKYGRAYVEDFKKCCQHILSQSSKRTEDVIYCFEDAITAVEPLSSYFPCSFFYKMGLKIFHLLPSVAIETYQYYQMPFLVKPAALLRKGEKNGVKNGVH